MNYPTSDIQFLAEMVKRLHDQDQITTGDRHRIGVLAAKGFSSSSDELEAVDYSTPQLAPHAQNDANLRIGAHPDVTRLR